MYTDQLRDICKLLNLIDERAIITNDVEQIVYANELFLESIDVSAIDVELQYYKDFLQFDRIKNNYFIFENNQSFYLSEISLKGNNLNKVFIFISNSNSNQNQLAASYTIFDSIPDIISIHDKNFEVLYYNKAGYDFLQLNQWDVVGKKCYTFLGRTKECEDCPVSKSVLTGKIVQKTTFFPELNKWLDIRAYPIKDENGKVVQIIEHLRDISEQKELEKRFIESEVKLGRLIDNIPGVVYRCHNDVNWTMLFMSHETYNLTGYQTEDFISNKNIAYNSIVHPDDRNFVRKIINDGLKSNWNFIVEYRIINKDGQIKHVWEKGKVTIDDNIEYIDGVIIDITNRKIIETDLKNSEEKYRLLVENQNELIIKLDKHGRFMYVNKAYCDFFGKSEEDLHNSNFMPYIHDDDKQSTNLSMTMLNKYPHTCYIEHRVMSAKGWKWLAWSYKAILNSKNEIFKIIGVGRDVTERKIMEYEIIKAKEKAERNDNLKSTFLQNVNQKIQKPVDELNDLIQLLNISTDCKESKLRINDSMKKLYSYVQNIAEISEIEMGKTKLNLENFDINLLIKKVVENINSTFNNLYVRFVVKIEIIDPFFVFSDKVKVRQILLHLLSNAFKFTESGEIEFGYKVSEEDIEFYINDTGKGMSEEALNQIFNWISVSDMESSKITKGFGIPISKAYIDLLGGDMSITSLLEKGTNVKIRIPIKGKVYNEQKHLEYSNKAIDLNSYIILVAEDEKINYQLLKTILSKAGATVLRAKTGLEAVEIVKTNKQISIVLMDIKMPGLNGYEALIEIKKIRKDLKVIACTAFTKTEDSNKFSKEKFDGFLTKPIKRMELYKLLRELL